MANPTSSSPPIFKHKVNLPVVLNQEPVYRAYEHQLWDYLQKEAGSVSSFWFSTRPDAWSDPRVGLLRDEMNARIETYKKVIDSEAVWKRFQRNHLEQLQLELSSIRRGGDTWSAEDLAYGRRKSTRSIEHLALMEQVYLLSSSHSFAEYARKTGQYPRVQETFRISNESDDKKQVDWTKTKINAVLEARFNSLQALAYQLQQKETLTIPKTRQRQRIKETENAFLQYWQDAPNDSDKNAFAKTVTTRQMSLIGEAAAYRDIIAFYRETTEWEELKTFKAQQMDEKRTQKDASYQAAKKNVERLCDQIDAATDTDEQKRLEQEMQLWDKKAAKLEKDLHKIKDFQSAWESGDLALLAQKMSARTVCYEGALRMEHARPSSLQTAQEDLLKLTQAATEAEKEYIVMFHARNEYNKAVQNGHRQITDLKRMPLDETFEFQKYVEQNQKVLARYMDRLDSTCSRELIKMGVQGTAAYVAQAGVRSAQAATVAGAPLTGGTSLAATAALEGCAWAASAVAWEMAEPAAESVGEFSSSLLNHWAEKDLEVCIQYIEKQKENDLKQLQKIDAKKYREALDFAIRRTPKNTVQAKILERVKAGESFFAASQAEGFTGYYIKPSNLDEAALKHNDARLQKKLRDSFIEATSVKTELDMRSKLIKQYEKALKIQYENALKMGFNALKMGFTDKAVCSNQSYPLREQACLKGVDPCKTGSSLIQTLESKGNHTSNAMAPVLKNVSEPVLLTPADESRSKQEYSR